MVLLKHGMRWVVGPQLNLGQGTPLGNQPSIKISLCPPLWRTESYTPNPILRLRWTPFSQNRCILDTHASTNTYRQNVICACAPPAHLVSLTHTHTYTVYLYTPTCSHSVSSGQESSCEAPCKLPVITAVSQNSVKERERREERRGETEREGNQ